MLSNKKKGASASSSSGQALNTIIGRGSHFEGKLTVDNSVRIDGVFKGELICSGELTISQSGEADATLMQCKDAYIDGVVNGTVRADKVRLDTQSRFTGEVYTDSFTVAEGAIFHGSCSMENHQQKSQSAIGAPDGAAAKPLTSGPGPQVQKGASDGAAAKPLTSGPGPQVQKK
ncbi:MAG: polymer-forming cytoskeletal protein [Gemmatimonadetes bacterium]|nr:polymer-forming cytoskeletal protein [Gemmatimonadota bacterium]MYC69784.1 polymer-forming cytoskeletal protein [Gemmatimonadota bacterium]